VPLTTGLGIDIWHGARPSANSSKRSRSLHPSGRAANRDRHPSTPERQLPHAPFGSWFVSQIIPAAPNTRSEVRCRPPNTQPRMITAHPPAYPPPNTHRTVRCGNHRGNESEQGRSPRARPTSRHFEDRLEDVSYFLSYNYPIRVGMAHHEGRTVRLAMALRITCRMDRSGLHHLRRDLGDPAADHRPGHLRGAHQVADLGSCGHAIGSFATLSPRFREPGLATEDTFRGLLRET
jgi:hypothetical protein